MRKKWRRSILNSWGMWFDRSRQSCEAGRRSSHAGRWQARCLGPTGLIASEYLKTVSMRTILKQRLKKTRWPTPFHPCREGTLTPKSFSSRTSPENRISLLLLHILASLWILLIRQMGYHFFWDFFFNGHYRLRLINRLNKLYCCTSLRPNLDNKNWPKLKQTWAKIFRKYKI